MNPPSFETLQLTFDEHVAAVHLNRPDKANSMNATLWEDLQACFEWLDEEPSVRAVILAGNGKHFCAGLDLAMFGGLHGASSEPARRAEHLRRTILRLQGNLTAVEKCRKPVLAAIHNTCIGGGVDLVCCADMRYATEDAFFSIREIDLGMAADLGFVNRVYADREMMMREVLLIAKSIAAKSPLAVRGSKEMLLYSRDHSVAEGLNYVATWNSGMLSEADLAAGLQAQMEKRQATYED